MESRTSPRKPKGRTPLGDATDRVNNTNPDLGGNAPKTSIDDQKDIYYRHPGKPPHPTISLSPSRQSILSEIYHPSAPAPPVAANPRVSAIFQEDRDQIESRRASQVSTTSSSSAKGKTKSYIGPWQLGKTLGKGSSARVRAARHRLTHQPVAVKIVPKRVAHITQAGSLAKLDQIDKKLPEDVNGVRRMPLTIEREVAILKLIEHPNIVKLYDIWENRQEIYLILEYVEKGDLFEYINTMGRINEEDAIFVFRQMMSAVEYCHSYNICHRDLKPENILLKSDGQIKIADFGMAALHQGPQYHLRTSCGSPHYAAPELLKARTYRGDKADIWSMGVILFAMLAARLPFDDDNLHVMLSKAKKAMYDMPEFFSREAKDLIHRVLQVDPDVRINMQEMWKHPLIRKYEFVDELGRNSGQPPDVREGKQSTPLDPDEIDPQTLRQLRAMWHTFSEKNLIAKLVSNEVNDQKLFYWLLHNYREKQLENYNPGLTHSGSDYHHLKPSTWTKQVSTRQFSQRKGNGHGRSFSRFTVISNVAETEVGTVRSYDPFKSSQVLHPCNSQVSHAKITIHRNDPDAAAKVVSIAGSQNSRTSSSVPYWKRKNLQRGNTASRVQSPKGSMSSIQSSRQGTPRVRANGRHRRGVDFSHVRKKSVDLRSRSADCGSRAGTGPGSENILEVPKVRVQSPRGKYRRSQVIVGTTAETAPGPNQDVVLFNEELRHFSTSIANHCDEAFRSSIISSESLQEDLEPREASPLSLTLGTPVAASTPTCVAVPVLPLHSHPWDSRPLPPPPLLSESMTGFKTTGDINDIGISVRPPSRRGPAIQETGAVGSEWNGHHDIGSSGTERRTVSAPLHAQCNKHTGRPLPAIKENSPRNWKQHDTENPRTVSAPPRTPARPSARVAVPSENRDLQFLARAEKTIRVVTSPPAGNSYEVLPVPVPRPLNVRKVIQENEYNKHPAGVLPPLNARESQASYGEEQMQGSTQHQQIYSETGDPTSSLKKKKSWFRRASKEEVIDDSGPANASQRGKETIPVPPARTESQSTGVPPLPPLIKKKGFALNFWKNTKQEHRMSLAGPEYDDHDMEELHTVAPRKSARSVYNGSLDTDSNSRKIEPQQNWLARLFHIKPATQYLCVAISRRRARQEVAILLREWRKYGMRDVEVDKDRDIVFARVGARNYLNMKEVSFAAEIITVIEHGKRSQLAIIRFTQEKGAASSFHKVVDTIDSVLAGRNLLVSDKRRAKMMLKTLNS